MARITIKETNLVTGKTRNITTMKHTTRGWFSETKTFKTESSAKAWITKRIEELKGTINENTFSYEIICR